MKILFPVLAAALALAACTASAPPANGEAQIRRQCEQHFAKVADVMERGKKVKACIRSRSLSS